MRSTESRDDPTTTILLSRNANGGVVKATKTIAAALAVKNDFPVFMAVMDVAWLVGWQMEFQ